MENVRDLISSGDAQFQLQEEIKHLSKEERQDLLKKAGFTLEVSPEQGLAMKADLGIPWNKLRIIRRQEMIHNLVMTNNLVITIILDG